MLLQAPHIRYQSNIITAKMRVAAPSIALAIAQISTAASLPQLEARQSSECAAVHIFLGKGSLLGQK